MFIGYSHFKSKSQTCLLSAIVVVDKIPNKLKRISLRNQGANNTKGRDRSATNEPFVCIIYQSRARQKRTNIDKLALTKHFQQARCQLNPKHAEAK